jgi:hypothetical protein
MTQLQPFLAAFHRLDPIYGQEILRGGGRRSERMATGTFIFQDLSGKTDILHFGSAPAKSNRCKMLKI